MIPDLENRFTYHPPQDEQTVELYQMIRDHGHRFAELIDRRVPDGREKSLAITHIEETVMWANAAIARRKQPPEETE